MCVCAGNIKSVKAKKKAITQLYKSAHLLSLFTPGVSLRAETYRCFTAAVQLDQIKRAAEVFQIDKR